MVKAPYIDKNGLKKGAWGEDEDQKLRAYVHRYGHWNWRLLPKFAGLRRCGKSCRLRWMNYLKPGVKRGEFTQDERDLIANLHQQLGNKWSAIAAKLPGRTDNDVKNYWQTLIQRSEKRSNSTTMSAPHSEDKIQPTKYYCRNVEAAVSTLTEVTSRSRKRDKSEVSCDDIFILESSSSNSVLSNAAFGWDLNLSVEQNGFEIS